VRMPRIQVDEPVDVKNTLESGQSFLWTRERDGGEGDDANGWYSAVVDGEGVRVRDAPEGWGVEYETTGLEEARVRELLGIDDPLGEIHDAITGDERVARAVEEYGGMRVVSDPFFPCVVSFIVSAQNRIPRIRRLVNEMAEKWGEPVEGYGHDFPSPETLSEVGEEPLRELGLGYRAPYVVESARLVADGTVDPDEIKQMSYHDAHDAVQELVGVGDKVGDCVLLFSLGFGEAVPLDTWMLQVVEEHYPEMNGGTYDETADAFRDRFGEHAGYAQNYLFHYERHDGQG
jgi:N-glycosylase/DNA lyase